MGFKIFCRQITPPCLWNVIKSLRSKAASEPGSMWEDGYVDWNSALANSSGYDSNEILEKVFEAARMVRDGEALWERDSVCFYHEEYNYHLLTALFQVAAVHGGVLNVLDYGGALGSTYMQHRKPLSALTSVSWNIVEQNHVVRCGQEFFANDRLAFFTNVEAVFAARSINLVVLSGVLQYMEYPHDFLDNILTYAPFAVYVGRTPVHDSPDILTVQRVPESIYNASYPCWFFQRQDLLSVFEDKYNFLPWIESSVDGVGTEQCFLWAKNSE